MQSKPSAEQRRGGKARGAVNAAQQYQVWSVAKSDPHFPPGLARTTPHAAWSETLYGIGDRDLLKRKCLGLICSVKCPGNIVIKTFDAIRELRDVGVVVSGGFHSPMEQECLQFLLRGKQPVVVCPAKYPGSVRLPADWRSAMDAGRLLLVAPFANNLRRTTSAQAQIRNGFIAAIAAVVLLPHASPGGKAEATAKVAKSLGTPLFTFDDVANQELSALGALPYSARSITEYCRAA